MSNKSEPARVRELATKLIKLHGETANTYGDDALWYSAAALRRCANRCENTHPAPALTAELKAELIECLKMGLTAQMYVHGTERKSPNFIKEVYFERQDKIQAAITKLTNL